MKRLEAIGDHVKMATIPEPLRQAWQTLDFHRKRAIIETVVSKVIVKASRPGPYFNPARIKIVWKV